MERLEFDCDYDISDEIESIIENTKDKNYLISVYGKYDVIKTILENLIIDDFSISNEIELEDYDISHYDKEFVLYVSEYGINVEKVYRNDSYLYGSGDISFVHEDCSSTLLKYIDSDRVYEFGYINEEDSDEKENSELVHEYIVNGKSVDKETFDDYVSKFATDLADKDNDTSNNNDYSICVKRNLNAYKASKIIKDMEYRMMHMNDMLREMDCFRRLFNW